MDAGRQDATIEAEPLHAPSIFRGPCTQREVDAILARLRRRASPAENSPTPPRTPR